MSLPRHSRRWMGIALAGVILIAIASLWFASRSVPPRVAPVRQLTFDAGIATTPAFSPDGRLLAFASDRAESGNLDIWLRQVAGGSFARLTTQPGADWNPQFAPDGTRLLYLTGDQSIVDIPVIGGVRRRAQSRAAPVRFPSPRPVQSHSSGCRSHHETDRCS